MTSALRIYNWATQSIPSRSLITNLPGISQTIKKHETVQQTNNDRRINDWRNEVTIADKYQEHHPEFLKLLEAFADMRDGHLGRNKTKITVLK